MVEHPDPQSGSMKNRAETALSYVSRGELDEEGLMPDHTPLAHVDFLPWERQHGEPHDWYQFFFSYYVTQGPRRTIIAAYRKHLKEQGRENVEYVTSPTPAWHLEARRWDWKVRAEAYDEDQRLQEQYKWEERQRELREREWSVSNNLLTAASNALARFTKSTKPMDSEASPSEPTRDTSGRVLSPKPVVMKAGEVARFAELGSTLGRRATDLVTDRSELSVKVQIEETRRRRWEEATPKLKDVIEGQFKEVGDEVVEPHVGEETSES